MNTWSRPSSMFIVPGRTGVILLSWFIVCCECFIHLFSSIVQGWSPGRGPGDGVPQKLDHFLKVHSLKFKARWKWKTYLMPFFYCSAHQHWVVSVSCCTMFGILGEWPASPSPNPPLPAELMGQNSIVMGAKTDFDTSPCDLDLLTFRLPPKTATCDGTKNKFDGPDLIRCWVVLINPRTHWNGLWTKTSTQ